MNIKLDEDFLIRYNQNILMEQITKSKIENGTLTLPQGINRSWQNRDVLIFPENDRLIIQPLEAEWDSYEVKLKNSKTKPSQKIINEAVAWAKKRA